MDHEHPYKELFTQPELVADLIRLAGHDLAGALDLDSLDRRNGSYVADDWRERENDVIWRVRWAGGDLWVYLLIEFQSAPDADMAVRLLTYVGLLWQDLRRSGASAVQGPLPPVLPIVLYNGEAPWTAPRDLHAAMGPLPPMLAPFQPQLAYLLLDEVRMQLRDEHERNLAAAVFRLERTGAPAEHLAIARCIAAWLRGPGKARIIATFQRWWMRTLSLRHSLPASLNPFTDDPMLTTRIEQWTSQVEARGMARGQAEGHARGQAEGRINTLLEEVRDGETTAERAIARLRHWTEQGLLPPDLAEAALRSLCVEGPAG